MPRLPVVGEDVDERGELLSEFLRAGHKSDGHLKGTVKVGNVRDYGAIGGSSEDQNALAAALRENDVVYFPQPERPYRVTAPLKLRVNQVLIGPGKSVSCLRGDGSDPVVEGDGSGPVFVTNPYPDQGDMHDVRGIVIRDLRVRTKGNTVLQLYRCPDFAILNCHFGSAYDAKKPPAVTLEARRSARGIVFNSRVGQAGRGWAIALRDNCNGVTLLHNVVTGGRAGSGIDIGQCQCVNVQTNVLEVCGGYGIRVAGDAPGSGNCNGVNVSQNYLEQVRRPISLGSKFTVIGATVRSNYIGNKQYSEVASKEFGIEIGRVNCSTISNNSYRGQGAQGDQEEPEPFIYFTEPAVSKGQIVDCEIVDNFHNKVEGVVTVFEDSDYGGAQAVLPPGIYDHDQLGIPNDSLSSLKVPSGYRVTLFEHSGLNGKKKEVISDLNYVGDDFNDITSSIKVEDKGIPDYTIEAGKIVDDTKKVIHQKAALIFARNRLRFPGSAPTGVARQYLSETIQADKGFGPHAIVLATKGGGGGGIVDGVEVLEKRGKVCCVVRLGREHKPGEIADFNPAELEYDNGASAVALNPVRLIRMEQPLLLRVVIDDVKLKLKQKCKNKNTGTFRLRVSYRN